MSKGFPEQGTPWDTLKAQMEEMTAKDIDWRHGRNGYNVFFAGPDVLQVIKEAYSMFISENGLNQGAFPSLKHMEDEVVQMALDLFQAPEGATGGMTSGGTESIIMAVKACRERAREMGQDVSKANIVIPYSGHPAFNKAGLYLSLEVIRTPIDEKTRLPDLTAFEAAIDENTIMCVGSAPAFPSGVVEQIPELSEIARKHDKWFHVDACVGGYFAPFAEINGVDLPAYNFTNPGVSSMSADLHKFGYAAKGASTVLYRSEELQKYQQTDFNIWPSGRMVTPTLAGTRPGGAIAAAWAVMNYLGKAGYTAKAKTVLETRARLEKGLADLGFEVHGDSKLMIINFGKPGIELYALWGAMNKRGWWPGATTEPPALHMMLTPAHEAALDDFLKDLAEATTEVEKGQAEAKEVSYS